MMKNTKIPQTVIEFLTKPEIFRQALILFYADRMDQDEPFFPEHWDFETLKLHSVTVEESPESTVLHFHWKDGDELITRIQADSFLEYCSQHAEHFNEELEVRLSTRNPCKWIYKKNLTSV